jgi:hypothetical protein
MPESVKRVLSDIAKDRAKAAEDVTNAPTKEEKFKKLREFDKLKRKKLDTLKTSR